MDSGALRLAVQIFKRNPKPWPQLYTTKMKFSPATWGPHKKTTLTAERRPQSRAERRFVNHLPWTLHTIPPPQILNVVGKRPLYILGLY